MKIVTKLKLSSIATIVILCSVCLTLSWHYSVSQKVLQQDHIVDNVLKSAFDLNILTNTFVHDHSERSKQQWYSRHDSLLNLIDTMGESSTENTLTLTKIKRNSSDMRIIFDILVNHFENSSKQKAVIRHHSELDERFANQLLVKAQMVATNAQRLEHKSKQNRNRLQRKFNVLILCFVVLFASSFCFIAFLIIRNVTNPIKKLVDDAKNIGRGDFHLLSTSGAQDEIGDLARSFAQMAEDLSLITVSRDRLTEEIKSREQTEKQVQLLAKFPSENPSPVLRVGKDGGIIYANQGAATLLKEWGCNVGGLLPTEYSNIIVDIFYRGAEETIERLIGDQVFSIHFCPVLSDGYVNLYCHDITDLKKAEKNLIDSQSRYRSLIENLDIGVTLMDKSHNIIMTNSSMGKMFNKSVSEFVGKKCYQEFEKKEHICSHCPGTIAMKSSLPQSVQTQRKRDDGCSFTVNVRALPLLDKDSKVAGFIEVVEDITEKEKEKDEKANLEKRLQQAHKMQSIGNLAGGIAHDFNNILASILGFSELALDEVEKGSTMEGNLQEIHAGGHRAKEVVKQILAFARQSDEEIKPTRVDTVIIEALKLIRPSTPTSIEIQKEIASSSLVMGNATQIHQIILNLCTNASHAMRDDGGIMKVSLKDTFFSKDNGNIAGGINKGNYIELVISDTGYGIAHENIESIFDPYFTTKETGEGTGMGLAMVRGIIDSYGGSITVESSPSIKTIFTIYLPITSNLDSEIIYEAKTLPRGGEHILFVDDEPSITRMGSRILESLGYQVTTRTSSVEALELFKTKPGYFQLVITDMTMPHMNGDKFAIELRQIRADIPIVLCTGYSNKISAEIAQKIGINAFTDKPFTKTDLANTVREVLDKA